ncbi:hypothetical protein FB451DRAFT_1561768 [Mycena latifolia]|nr:hypothetical protein FB451DRAFT_1561768 [Mycena latifolia]
MFTIQQRIAFNVPPNIVGSLHKLLDQIRTMKARRRSGSIRPPLTLVISPYAALLHYPRPHVGVPSRICAHATPSAALPPTRKTEVHALSHLRERPPRRRNASAPCSSTELERASPRPIRFLMPRARRASIRSKRRTCPPLLRRRARRHPHAESGDSLLRLNRCATLLDGAFTQSRIPARRENDEQQRLPRHLYFLHPARSFQCPPARR